MLLLMELALMMRPFRCLHSDYADPLENTSSYSLAYRRISWKSGSLSMTRNSKVAQVHVAS